jgi:hypothetical protein
MNGWFHIIAKNTWSCSKKNLNATFLCVQSKFRNAAAFCNIFLQRVKCNKKKLGHFEHTNVAKKIKIHASTFAVKCKKNMSPFVT